MHPTIFALVLAFWFLNSPLLVDAELYVVQPSLGSKCHGGQNCTIKWLDDGARPLLAAIGVCTMGLYTGKQQLVQELPPVDVSTRFSITFTPNPRAGPNSNTYYIGIISTSLKQSDNVSYAAFSPSFSIDNMLGSFQSPFASATSTKPLPLSLVHPSSLTAILPTITVGTLSASDALSFSSTTRPSSSSTRMSTLTSPSTSPPTPTSSTSSKFSSSPSSTSTPTSTGTLTSSRSTSLAPPASTSSSSGALSLLPTPILCALGLPIVLSFVL